MCWTQQDDLSRDYIFGHPFLPGWILNKSALLDPLISRASRSCSPNYLPFLRVSIWASKLKNTFVQHCRFWQAPMPFLSKSVFDPRTLNSVNTQNALHTEEQIWAPFKRRRVCRCARLQPVRQTEFTLYKHTVAKQSIWLRKWERSITNLPWWIVRSAFASFNRLNLVTKFFGSHRSCAQL